MSSQLARHEKVEQAPKEFRGAGVERSVVAISPDWFPASVALPSPEEAPKSGARLMRTRADQQSRGATACAAMPTEPDESHESVSPNERAAESDRDLVLRAQAGDRAAYGVFAKRHYARIHRLASHMVRDASAAEDVAQESFIRAYRAIASFDGRSEPFTWLYRIAVNLSLNHLRSRKTSTQALATQDARLEALGGQTPAQPSEELARRRQYEALCEGIDRLSEALRVTLILVCVDGVSHDAAATVLGVPEGTIAWRVHEARKKLRAFLEERDLSPP